MNVDTGKNGVGEDVDRKVGSLQGEGLVSTRRASVCVDTRKRATFDSPRFKLPFKPN